MTVSENETPQVEPSDEKAAEIIEETKREVAAKIESEKSHGSAPDFDALNAKLDALPDRIVDAIREATKPAKPASKPKAEKPSADTAPGDKPESAKNAKRSFADRWFGDN